MSSYFAHICLTQLYIHCLAYVLFNDINICNDCHLSKVWPHQPKQNIFIFYPQFFIFIQPYYSPKQYLHFCFCLNQARCTSHVHLIQRTRNMSFLKFAFMIYCAFLVAIYDQRKGTHRDRLHKYHALWLLAISE